MRQWFAVLNSGLSGRHVNNILFAQSLHTTLLYTDEKQDFDIALETFGITKAGVIHTTSALFCNQFIFYEGFESQGALNTEICRKQLLTEVRLPFRNLKRGWKST